MPIKQEQFYTQIREETELKVKTYKEFQKQIDDLKKHTTESINALQRDMKFVAKQIESNNQMLTLQGLEPVEFDRK